MDQNLILEDEPPPSGEIQISNLTTSASQKLGFRMITIGNRVPSEYFIVQGVGESDLGYHPGAFDLALEKAGIPNYNLVSYSSLLPKNAKRIDPVKNYEHGAVLEAITAEAKGLLYPKLLTAGIIITKVTKNGELVGGLVAEYNGEGTREECADYLSANMASMVKRRYGEEVETDSEFFIESIEPKSKYACALVVIGFTSYKVPILAV